MSTTTQNNLARQRAPVTGAGIAGPNARTPISSDIADRSPEIRWPDVAAQPTRPSTSNAIEGIRDKSETGTPSQSMTPRSRGVATSRMSRSWRRWVCLDRSARGTIQQRSHQIG
jgi:hypothetical protein